MTTGLTNDSATNPTQLVDQGAAFLLPPPPRIGHVWVWTCDGCDGLTSHPQQRQEFAASLAVVHNDMHHRGWPIARVLALPGDCEFCGRRHATTTVPAGTPGAALGAVPYAVCQDCRPPAPAGLGMAS